MYVNARDSCKPKPVKPPYRAALSPRSTSHVNAILLCPENIHTIPVADLLVVPLSETFLFCPDTMTLSPLYVPLTQSVHRLVEVLPRPTPYQNLSRDLSETVEFWHYFFLREFMGATRLFLAQCSVQPCRAPLKQALQLTVERLG